MWIVEQLNSNFQTFDQRIQNDIALQHQQEKIDREAKLKRVSELYPHFNHLSYYFI